MSRAQAVNAQECVIKAKLCKITHRHIQQVYSQREALTEIKHTFVCSVSSWSGGPI